MNNLNIKKILIPCALCAFSLNVSAVTVDAGDYTRLPDGTNLAVLYLQNTSGSDLYGNGDKVSNNADLDVNLSILRAVHFMDVGDYTIVPQFLLPIGGLDTGGILSETTSENGIGDLIFAPTFHFIQDPERKESLAFTPWITAPTGTYDKAKTFNALGENRWKVTLQLGYITPISEKWTIDVVGDVTLYGDNDKHTSNNVKLEQDPLYELQTHLRYSISSSTYLAGMVSYSWGGATVLDGVEQDNDQSRTKALVSVGHFMSPTWQVVASYGQDMNTDEGVKEDTRFNIRLLKAF